MKKALTILLLLAVSLSLAACGEQKNIYAPDYLVLVNKENLIPGGFSDTIELAEIDNVYGDTSEVEIAAYEAYIKLHDALLEKGVEIGVDSAYRSVERQQEIMDDFTEKYGAEYAKATVAVPGSSEHHTGLAIDIVPKLGGEWIVENEDMMEEPEVFEMIHEMLPEYGFILRYIRGKEDITGYSYEPWHLRYVGKDAAKKMYEQGLCLEEYLAE